MSLESKFQNPKFRDIVHFARETLGLPESVAMEISPLKGRGSDRAFWRVMWNRKNSAILIHYDSNRLENTYYAEIAAFLHSIDVPVPRLIRHDPNRCFILTEDLGDADLWSFRKTPWKLRKSLYQKTLALVYKLHSFPRKNFPWNRVRLMESFGPRLYRWERNYFKDHFVREICGLTLSKACEQLLDAELSALAEQLQEQSSCLIHRDLQSQNVMIRNGEPFLIDFQGMRFGNSFYDLASLLCDPYVTFSESERLELLAFYYQLSHQDLDWKMFEHYFWKASVQRLMQALGAYGFLGLRKGLKVYLGYLPSGLNNLSMAVDRIPSLPQLRGLISKCRERFEPSE